jgi:FtsP/CotA-like multicopper oxidase with cupredoxin domain
MSAAGVGPTLVQGGPRRHVHVSAAGQLRLSGRHTSERADTVNLQPGDDVWVAFRADNPGIWMDHCHNLYHAAAGMLMHLAYRGVTSPFRDGHGNISE